MCAGTDGDTLDSVVLTTRGVREDLMKSIVYIEVIIGGSFGQRESQTCFLSGSRIGREGTGLCVCKCWGKLWGCCCWRCVDFVCVWVIIDYVLCEWGLGLKR